MYARWSPSRTTPSCSRSRPASPSASSKAAVGKILTDEADEADEADRDETVADEVDPVDSSPAASDDVSVGTTAPPAAAPTGAQCRRPNGEEHSWQHRRSHAPAGPCLVLGVLTALVFGLIWVAAPDRLGEELCRHAEKYQPRLGLDLEGGTSVILTPRVAPGEKGEITQDNLDQAVEIIRNRVDSFGVAESEVTTAGNNIVISIPGKQDRSILDTVRQTAELRFRQVLQTAAGVADPPPSAEPGASSGTASPAPSGTPAPGATPSGAPSPAERDREPRGPEGAAGGLDPERVRQPDAERDAVRAERASHGTPGDTSVPPAPARSPRRSSSSSPSSTAPTPRPSGRRCASRASTTPTPRSSPATRTAPRSTSSARPRCSAPTSAGRRPGCSTNNQGISTGGWVVQLDFTGEGKKKFGDITRRLFSEQGDLNRFAIVLDGLVVSAPTTNAVITNGQAEITGNFTQAEAADLANVLKFGALPLTFDPGEVQEISATLGGDQLRAGLIAGVIGLLLVVLYSLLYYRGLGLVTIASLAVAAVITYGMVVLLGWQIGFRLSLAGIAGLIVAIGITADSFIVYFERIRDEVREGKPMRVAVESGWARARRTILAADFVSFLAARRALLALGRRRAGLRLHPRPDDADRHRRGLPVHQAAGDPAGRGRSSSAQGHRLSGLDPERLGATRRRP